jgi:hypothetical protein
MEVQKEDVVGIFIGERNRPDIEQLISLLDEKIQIDFLFHKNSVFDGRWFARFLGCLRSNSAIVKEETVRGQLVDKNRTEYDLDQNQHPNA